MPTTVRDEQSFLGLYKYFRCFISKFAHVARPLTDLTHKKLEFSWHPEYQQAFDALKWKLLYAPVLTVLDPVARSEVWCDASNFMVGAVLMQQNIPDSPWQPVEYLSKHLNSDEYNYSATEHEFVGLIQALRTWCHYLLGRPVIIRTDHASLQWLTLQLHLSRRQVRWLEFMSKFDLTIGHVPGKANVVADALSHRADLDPARVAIVSVSVESDLLAALCLAQEQGSSDAFRDLKRRAIANDRGMCMHDGLVCRTSRTSGQLIVVPNDKALR